MATKKTPTAAKPSAAAAGLTVETLKHADDTRKNIPTAEYQSVMKPDEQGPVLGEYIAIDPRRMY